MKKERDRKKIIKGGFDGQNLGDEISDHGVAKQRWADEINDQGCLLSNGGLTK